MIAFNTLVESAGCTEIADAVRDIHLRLWSDRDAISKSTLPPESCWSYGHSQGPTRSADHLTRRLWAVTTEQFNAYVSSECARLDPRITEEPDTKKKARLLKAKRRDLETANVEIAAPATPWLREYLLPFPSAPIYRTNRPDRGRAHSMRVLELETSPDELFKLPRPSADHVFILFNGLDELIGTEFFYTFSYALLKASHDAGRRAIAIIRPFPGHLTRYSSDPRYSEKPLDHYLNDSFELFRHFLRHMVETQWLVSTLASRDGHDSLSGSRLTGSRTTEPDTESRSDTRTLAMAIRKEYKDILAGNAKEQRNKVPSLGHFQRALEVLRAIVGNTPISTDELPSLNEKPTISVVGYSLGGFVAQSAFLSWPFAIDNCITLCSGGSLRDISPVAFASPEEWQTLTHSMRYSIDYATRSGALGKTGQPALGLPERSFDYFQRIFYEIFEQNYRSSYRSRVSEYLQRMLFIVGGDDRIIEASSVLDATPAEGANLIEIGGVNHFLSAQKLAGGTVDKEQRLYWFPAVARLITDWTMEAKRVRTRSVRTGWRDASGAWFHPDSGNGSKEDQAPEGERKLTDQERQALGAGGSAGTPLFERLLDSLLRRALDEHGFLFISHNDVPTFMLNEDFRVYRAKALHHSEDEIAAYLRRVAAVENVVDRLGQSVIVLIRSDWETRLRATFAPGLTPPSCELAVGEVLDRRGTRSPKTVVEETISHFREQWIDCATPTAAPRLLLFEPGTISADGTPGMIAADGTTSRGTDPDLLGHNLDPFDLLPGDLVKHLTDKEKANALRDPVVIGKLPDSWLWLSPRGSRPGKTAPNSSTNSDPESGIWAAAISNLMFTHTRGTSYVEEALLKNDAIAAMTVSRARYNPRHRGAWVTRAGSAVTLIQHFGFAVALSKYANPALR